MLAGLSVGLHWPMKLAATASGWRAGSLLAGSRHMSSIRRALRCTYGSVRGREITRVPTATLTLVVFYGLAATEPCLMI